MGIYLPNMEMPKSCMVCPMYSMSEHWCDAKNRNLTHAISESTRRAEWCPLVPVPKHGKLIDQKELMKRFCGHCDGYEECSDKSMCSRAEECFDLKLIANTPTVIEAEDGGE